MYIKRTILFLFLVLFILTCTKEDYSWQDNPDLWTAKYPPREVICKGPPFCNDTCQTYYDIWKELFISKNEITHEFFYRNITQENIFLHRWNDGIAFNINYTVKVGWAQKRLNDKFVIFIDTDYFPLVTVPRRTLLSKDQVDTVTSGFHFGSRIFRVNPVSALRYDSPEEAIEDLREATGNSSITAGEVFFEQGFNDSLTIGNPCLEARGIINRNANKCITCYIDLVTGKIMTEEIPCVIIDY